MTARSSSSWRSLLDLRPLPGTSRRFLPGDPFMGLHCERLPASTVVRDFEQRTMSSANGASDALGMGPSAGYTLISVITVLCVLTVSISCIDQYIIYACCSVC